MEDIARLLRERFPGLERVVSLLLRSLQDCFSVCCGFFCRFQDIFLSFSRIEFRAVSDWW